MPRALPQLFAAVHAPPALATSLDPALQAAVARVAGTAEAALPPRVALAVMVADLPSRRLAALWLGAWDSPARGGRLDPTRALRSPGSTLKPFLYALAFADGLAQPDTLLADVPTHYGAYGPEDFSGRFAGRVSAADALRRSLNLPAVGLLARYGAPRFAAALAAAGAPPVLPAGAAPSLPLALGGAGLTMRQLMALYGALATDGRAMPPALLASADERAAPRLLPPAAAEMVADILTRPLPGAPGVGGWGLTGVAWKTGTSWDNRDNWAFGFDRAHLVGVWVGRPDGTPMAGGQASERALPVLARVFGALPAAPRTPAAATPPLSLAAAPEPDPLRLLFPPPGAVIAGTGPLELRAMGGQRPLRFLVNGRPLPPPGPLRAAPWEPPGPGFYRIVVLDATGAAARAAIRVTGDTAPRLTPWTAESPAP